MNPDDWSLEDWGEDDDGFADDRSALDHARERLTARLSDIINPLADRRDLLLETVWDPEHAAVKAPAWFDPATATVTVNAGFVLGQTHPDRVEPRTPQGRMEHPEIVGLCCHEASHAHSTRWPVQVLQRLPQPLLAAFTMLEEPRIEYRQIERRAEDRPYLRAQSVLLDLEPYTRVSSGQVRLDRWNAATVALMTLGRVDARVLYAEDVTAVEPLLRAVLGSDLDLLRQVWRRAIILDDGDLGGLLDCAQDWVLVLGEAPATFGAGTGCAGAGPRSEGVASLGIGGGPWGSEESVSDLALEQWASDGPPDVEDAPAGAAVLDGGSGSAEPSDAADTPDDVAVEAVGMEPEVRVGAGDDERDERGLGGLVEDSPATDAALPGSAPSSGEAPSLDDLLSDAVHTALQEASEDASRDVGAANTPPSPDPAEQRQQEAAQDQADRDAQSKARDVADRVFNSSQNGQRGGGRGPQRLITGTRVPTEEEQALARRIRASLERAQFRERSMTKVRSDLPPGRLVGREAMLRQAQRSQRQTVTARPFVSVRRRRNPEPPVTLGVMVDLSGSMSWAVVTMSSLAWAFAHAMKSIKGRCAVVGYAQTVIPVVAPGKPPSLVTEFRAPGSYEAFRRGFAALDGALNLTMGDGVRLLVVVTDGCYLQEEQEGAAEAVERMRRRGGHVLWVHEPLPFIRELVPEGAISLPVMDVALLPQALTEAFAEIVRRA